MKNILSIGSIAVTSLALNLIPVGQAQAVTLQNGGFIPSGISQSAYLGNTPTNGRTVVTIPGWTFAPAPPNSGNNGYNFIVPDGTAFKTNMAALGNAPYGGLSLYGGSSQTVNSVDGSGWFIAADGAFEEGSISQQLNDLTPGNRYDVNFWQAAGQQSGFEGDTTDRWRVSLDGVSQLSALIELPSKANVTPWQRQTLTFTATSSSQVLSFLAVGTPTGLPPFSLLSGVSVTAAVPEPLTIVGTLVGLGFGAGLRSKLTKKKLAENE
ncbi:PEP-CTERM sorting domain-containing protein [Chamaesiphon minutus]|uniref:PEP-CTERM putative exosortase interaction domain-containing protein n=1 Tax=Chamaesiphon minutus (strain ATCC 27169 / PCC 6605) TaxID=1173020 RepID=K9UR66_CHAP6|nr:PEP-CTERM sorting domain-containing protein [Chamaesiphon minutus]AFY96744.1 PEP-CTERM putative exosortase interaction domain-containing protein [Chamaesiphon minutus PCC 6605]